MLKIDQKKKLYEYPPIGSNDIRPVLHNNNINVRTVDDIVAVIMPYRRNGG